MVESEEDNDQDNDRHQPPRTQSSLTLQRQKAKASVTNTRSGKGADERVSNGREGDIRGGDAAEIFVGALPQECDERALLDYFRQFGQVVDSVVMRHRETRASRRFGFVRFKSNTARSRRHPEDAR